MLTVRSNHFPQAALLAAGLLLVHVAGRAAPSETASEPAPAPIAAPPEAAPKPPADAPGADFDADRRLAERMATHATAGLSSQVDYGLAIAWSTQETDESLRKAALRKLLQTDSRQVAEVVIVRIAGATPEARIGMIELMAQMFSTLGGTHSSLNQALAEQIRFPVLEVSKTAIETCSQLRLPEAYLPLREIATRPGAALRTEAIVGLSRLGDPRAVEFFRKLLDEGSVPRDIVYEGLATLGRPASLLLKSKLDDKDPAERLRAIDALLLIATIDDLTTLYAYVHKYRPEGDLRQKIYNTIATIEARAAERPLGVDD